MWIRYLVTWLLILAVNAPAMSQLQHFQTSLTLQEPVVNTTGVNSVIFRWSTFESVGTVTETELYNLTLLLRIEDELRYVDTVVVGGVVQPFEGQSRISETDYFWRFNFGTGELEQMLNVSSDLAMNSSGEHYVVNDSVTIQTDGIVDVSQFLDGVNQDGASDQLQIQVTAPMLYFDGFESGDLSLWSATMP